MRWVEISVEAADSSEDAVTNILMDAGCGGTVILSEAKNLHRRILRFAQNDDSVHSDSAVTVTGYLPVDDRLEGKLDSIRERVRSLPDVGLEISSPEIGVRFVEDDDWVTAYRKFFKPIRFGRILVVPSWEADVPTREDDVIVRIDPGMAFGTGHHATTALCLFALQDYVGGGETVLDVGTGSGILSIAAAKLGARRVVGIDIDPVAVRVATENVEANGLAGRIDILQADSPLAFEGVADIVLANIVPNVIIAMARDLCAKVEPGGKLITSGIIRERAGEVRSTLESLGPRTIEQREDGDWVALVSER